MSLLTDASLLLTPNAYKEGKLYSVIPSNGNGDFTATRATTATRVNSAGLVDLVPYNLFNYSEMFSDALWTKTASSISPNTVIAPNGTLTADTLSVGIDASNQRHRIFQLKVFETGITYTYSVYLKQNQFRWVQIIGQSAFSTTAWCNFDLQDGVIGNNGGGFTSQTITSVGNGWWRISVTATAISSVTSDIDVVIPTNGTDSGRYPSWQSLSAVDCYYIWGAQLVEGTSARDYLRTETRLNIPRLDYSLGGCPNILLEPQRTNLNLHSEDLTNAYWSKFQSSISANAAIAPSGNLTADKIVEDTTTNAHSVFIGGVILSIGQSLTRSVYLKADGRIWAALAISESGVFHRAYFNLSNGTIGNVGAGVTASIEPAANGYYKCIITRVLTTTNPSSFAIELASANGTNSYLGNGVSGIFVWGAQVEVGAYSTSYIPTTTASVTRNADSITRNNIFTNGLITAAGGTWFVELRNNVVYTSGISQAQLLGLGNDTVGATANNIWLSCTNGFRIIVWKQVAGSLSPIYYTTADNCKLAIKWNGSTMDIFQNGVKVISATSFTPTSLETLRTVTTQHPYYINQMALYPTPLSDSELISMTTL